MANVYGVSIICRNEENNIGPCIESIFTQTIKPNKVVIIDDGSSDNTFDIIKKYEKQHNTIISKKVHNNRYNKIKGYNISLAINQSIHYLLTHCKPDYILRMDSDVVLNHEKYMENLLNIMETNHKIGITGGVSNKGIFMSRHITDAARVYRLNCLINLLETSPNKGYPIMYGHDSFMLFRARWLGWDIKPVNITFFDARPYQRSPTRWFLTGRFSYMNGFPLLYQIYLLFRYLFHKPYFIGSFINFFTYVLYYLLPYRPYEKNYYEFMKKDLINSIIYKLHDVFFK